MERISRFFLIVAFLAVLVVGLGCITPPSGEEGGKQPPSHPSETVTLPDSSMHYLKYVSLEPLEHFIKYLLLSEDEEVEDMMSALKSHSISDFFSLDLPTVKVEKEPTEMAVFILYTAFSYVKDDPNSYCKFYIKDLDQGNFSEISGVDAYAVKLDEKTIDDLNFTDNLELSSPSEEGKVKHYRIEAHCVLNNVPFMRYFLVGKDDDVLVNIYNNEKATIKYRVSDELEYQEFRDFPTGFGPLKFEIRGIEDRVLGTKGVDRHSYLLVKDSKDYLVYLYIGAKYQDLGESSYGITIKSVKFVVKTVGKTEGDYGNIKISMSDAKTTYMIKKILENGEDLNFICSEDVKGHKYTCALKYSGNDAINRKYIYNDPNGMFRSIAKVKLTIDTTDLDEKSVEGVVIVGTYSYELTIPIVDIDVIAVENE